MRLWLRLALGWLVFAVILFWPAGTLYWPEAWVFLGLYFVWAVPVLLWLKRNNPALLEERLKGPVQRGQKGWDRVLTLVLLPVFLAVLVVPGLDAVRFAWSRPPLVLEVAAFLAMVPSLILVFLTMRENTFLSKAVRIQHERGHHVITTGPYACVRHPMYVGIIALMLSMPVALGSLYGLVPAALVIVVILIRTALEDRTLHAELEGYPEYAETVRFRLLPGVW